MNGIHLKCLHGIALNIKKREVNMVMTKTINETGVGSNFRVGKYRA